MNFHVLTLFPEMVERGLSESITGRALKNDIIHLQTVDIRDFSHDKHRHVDDYPYGGGAGMVIKPDPVYEAYESLVSDMKRPCRVIYVTPQGKVFHQEMAKELAQEEDLVFLCGHYEGVDERILEEIVTDYVSIGDYVLTGGELPAMVMIDAISRMVPGVLSNESSAGEESLQNNLLEYPQYTRPPVFRGREVPEVLLSGHHARINEWRRKQSLLRTYLNRPDLLAGADLSGEDRDYLKSLGWEE